MEGVSAILIIAFAALQVVLVFKIIGMSDNIALMARYMTAKHYKENPPELKSGSENDAKDLEDSTKKHKRSFSIFAMISMAILVALIVLAVISSMNNQ